MHPITLLNKAIITLLMVFMLPSKTYAQKDIIKNGVKINRLDKSDKKQGVWFFFDENDDIILSCKYKDDSIISQLTFYQNNDTAFIRFPKMNEIETFIIQLNGQRIVGNRQQIAQDSSVVEFIGIYKAVAKDSFYLDSDSVMEFSKQTIDSINYWFNKQIPPIYMFGNARLIDYFYGKFHSSDFVFSKRIYSVISINESGIVTKVDFPRDKNNISIEEENELSYIFSTMQRWQPGFLKNKTINYSYHFIWSSTIKY